MASQAEKAPNDTKSYGAFTGIITFGDDICGKTTFGERLGD